MSMPRSFLWHRTDPSGRRRSTRPEANVSTDEEGFTDIPEPPAGLQVLSPEGAAGSPVDSALDAARNREIAQILQNPALAPAEKHARITAIRSGRGWAAEALRARPAPASAT